MEFDVQILTQWLAKLQESLTNPETLTAVAVETGKAVALVLAVLLARSLGRRLVVPSVHGLLKRTRNTLDDALVKRQVVEAAIALVPAVTLHYGLDFFDGAGPLLQRLVQVYMVFVCVRVVNRMLSAGLDIYAATSLARQQSLKGYVQLVKILVAILGIVLAVAALIDESPWGLLSGVGALTAVLLLIFKDTILSFVASIQIAAYDLVREGDWIEMPSMNANGDVEDMGLHTVKVRNFDKTVTAVPMYKFLDSTFINWRGMQESGGRRIKRSLLIDQSSIRLAEPELVQRLEKLRILAPHIEKRRDEIRAHNKELLGHDHDPDCPANGRAMTNIGLLRAYIEAYLRAHPGVHHGMTLMARQLQPTADQGLPLEIYCFSKTTNWVEYEGLQADLFDHFLAVIPLFGLRAYQRVALPDTRT